MNSEDYYLTEAQRFENEKKYLHALQFYEKLVKNKVFKRTAILKLVFIYSKLKNFQASYNILSEYLNNNKDDCDLRKLLVNILIKNNKFKEASENVKLLTAIDQEEVFFLDGLISFNLKEYSKAEESIKKFLNSVENSLYLPDAYLLLAEISYLSKGYEMSLKYLKVVEQLKGSITDVHFLKAKIYFEKGMLFHAKESSLKAIKIDKLNPEIKKLIGNIYFKLEEYDKAEEYFVDIIKSNEMDSDVFALLGHIHFTQKKNKSAQSYIDRALKINSNNSLALKVVSEFL